MENKDLIIIVLVVYLAYRQTQRKKTLPIQPDNQQLDQAFQNYKITAEKEKNTLITTLQSEIRELKKKLTEPQKTYQEWLDQGALEEKIISGNWKGYTYADASKSDYSSFREEKENLIIKWSLEELKEEIENHLPH